VDDPRSKNTKKPSPLTPAESVRDEDGERFVSRWSRLKREAREHPVEKPQVAPGPADRQAPAPDLPPPEALTFDSDYRQFFHPKVGEDVRRTALKKLFSDPRFNVMDGLDVYIDDYSRTEPIPAAMLAGLKQAQNILQWAKEDAEERRRKEEAGAADEPDAGRAALDPPAARVDTHSAPRAAEPAPISAPATGAKTPT
jgi:hypothetical protein